jgi:hypothetical protein
MRRSTVVLLGFLFAVTVSAASTPPTVSAEIAGLLARLESSGCEFNRNGTWYNATEAKAHLLFKLGASGTLQSAEQFIERVASKSSMTGEPYLVRCEISAPVQSDVWLLARLKEVRASPPESVPVDTAGPATEPVPEGLGPDDPFAPADAS